MSIRSIEKNLAKDGLCLKNVLIGLSANNTYKSELSRALNNFLVGYGESVSLTTVIKLCKLYGITLSKGQYIPQKRPKKLSKRICSVPSCINFVPKGNRMLCKRCELNNSDEIQYI